MFINSAKWYAVVDFLVVMKEIHQQLKKKGIDGSLPHAAHMTAAIIGATVEDEWELGMLPPTCAKTIQVLDETIKRRLEQKLQEIVETREVDIFADNYTQTLVWFKVAINKLEARLNILTATVPSQFETTEHEYRKATSALIHSTHPEVVKVARAGDFSSIVETMSEHDPKAYEGFKKDLPCYIPS